MKAADYRFPKQLLAICIAILLSLIVGCQEPTMQTDTEPVRTKQRDVSEYLKQGKTHIKSGRFKEAIEAFEMAININPDNAEAYYNLGLVYCLLGDKDLAMEQYEILQIFDMDLANKLLMRLIWVRRKLISQPIVKMVRREF